MLNITVTVDGKRRASSPREAFIIADNNDWGVTFEIDAASGFDTSAAMTAVIVSARGKLPDITFSAGQIALPRLIEEDGSLLYIGLTQGDIKTTGWACVRIQQSIYTKAHGRTAPDPENPPDYDALPVAEAVSLVDEVIITDVSAGRRERATLQLLSDLFGAESGHSPYIGTNGHWYEWDAEAAEYVDTGTPAQGQPGDSDFATVDLGDDFVTIQGLFDDGKTLIFSDSGRAGLMYDGESNRFYSFIVSAGAGYQIFKCTNGAAPEWTTETVHLPASVNGKTGAVVLDAEDVGAYEKPATGIPKSDLASAVQTSLGKADSALQSVPNTYRTASAQDVIDATLIPKPANPATGAFLVYNGSAWAAQTLSTWQGGSY